MELLAGLFVWLLLAASIVALFVVAWNVWKSWRR